MKVVLNRFLGIVVITYFLLTGCAGPQNFTREISDKLDQDVLYKSFDVQPKDLSLSSKCSAPPSVKIVNSESRTEDYLVVKYHSFTRLITPKEIMDSVSLYLKKGFEKSHIKVDGQSKKVLQLKMIDFQSTVDSWSVGSYVKVELSILNKNFSKIYEGKENSNAFSMSLNQAIAVALAYAIHDVTRQIIEDPAIQDYILCR